MAGQTLNVGVTVGYNGNGALRRATRDIGGMARQATVASKAFDAFTTRSSRGLRGLGHAITRQVSNVFRSFFFGVRIWAIAAGAAISGFVVTAVKSFTDFDKKLRESTSLIAGASAASGKGSMANRLKKARKDAQREYEIYKRDLMAMSVGLRTSPQDLAGGLYEVVSAGYSGRGQSRISQNLLRVGAMGAAAGGGQTDTSTRILIQMMNALGVKKANRRGKNGQFITGGPLGGKNSAMSIMDRVFQAVNFGVGVTFPDLSAALGNVIGPIGNVMNPQGTKNPGRGMQALNQVLASVVIGSQRGLTASKTTIGLADIVKRIQKPTKEAQDLYKQMGIEPGAGLFKNGLIGGTTKDPGALLKLSEGLKKIGYSGANASKGWFKLFGDIRAQRLITTLLNTNLNDTNSVLKLISKSSGATKSAFDEQGRSMQGMIDKFKALFETVKIGVGGVIAPSLSGLMGNATDFINQVTGGERGMLLNKARMDHPELSRKEFAETFIRKPGDRAAYVAYSRFTSAGFGGQLSLVLSKARDTITAWYRKPATQKMLGDALQSALNKAFELLGASVDALPSVYNLGVHLGGKIVEGMVSGLLASGPGAIGGALKGGGSGGGGGLLGGAGIADHLVGLALGGVLFKGARDKYTGNGVMSRGARGLALGAGAGLAGIPSMLLPAFMGMGALMPGKTKTPEHELIGQSVANALTGKSGQGPIVRMTASVVNLTARSLNMGGGAGGGGGGGGGGRGRRGTVAYAPTPGGMGAMASPLDFYQRPRNGEVPRYPITRGAGGRFMSQRQAVLANFAGTGAGAGGAVGSPILAALGLPPQGRISARYEQGAQFRDYLRTIRMETLSNPNTTASGILLPTTRPARTSAALTRASTAAEVLANINRNPTAQGYGGGATILGLAQRQQAEREMNAALAQRASYDRWVRQDQLRRMYPRVNGGPSAMEVMYPRVDSGYNPSRFQRGKYQFGRLGKYMTSARGAGVTGAAGMAALAAGSAAMGGGSTMTKLMSAIGGIAPLALLATPAAPAALPLSIVGGMGGAMLGGYLDQGSQAAEAAKKDKMVQAVFGAMKASSTKERPLDRNVLLQQLPYALAGAVGAGPGQGVKGIVGKNGMALDRATTVLSVALRGMGRAKTSDEFDKYYSDVNTYAQAMGIGSDTQLGSTLAALAGLASDRVMQIQAQKDLAKLQKELAGMGGGGKGDGKRKRRRDKYGNTSGGHGRLFPNSSLTELHAGKGLFDQTYQQLFQKTGAAPMNAKLVDQTFVSPVRAAGEAAANGWIETYVTTLSGPGSVRVREAIRNLTGTTPTAPGGRWLPNGTWVASAIGADVKSDGLMKVHKGEKVVPASATRSYRFPAGGGGGGGVVVNGPLIGTAHVGNERDADMLAKKLAQELRKHQGNGGKMR